MLGERLGTPGSIQEGFLEEATLCYPGSAVQTSIGSIQAERKVPFS